MACQVCGDERARYRMRSRLVLCGSCHATTPAKVDRAEFDAAFWGTGLEAAEVPEAIKREFFDDYRHSEHTLATYIERTTDPC